MKILIFAGGAGTRLWPLSRKATPKQFEQFFDGKSTLQLAIERIKTFGFENIYISTNDAYVEIIKEQIPELDPTHIFTEPAKRDLTAAIGLALARLKHTGVTGSVGMLWADHLMDHPQKFVEALKKADELITADPNRIVFLGETPRFANEQLGWIHMGEEVDDHIRAFKGWKYRPDLDVCKEMFNSGDWVWNPGYFVYDIDFILGIYEKYQGEMLAQLKEMVLDEEKLAQDYKNLPAIHFDNAIAEHIDPSQAVVLPLNMGWSDPGTLYAMKEALAQTEDENVEHGAVVTHATRDSFVYNKVDHQLVATVGLDGIVVVNTPDSILVCHKDHVNKLKAMLADIEETDYKDRL